jgi:hypothetical protein
MTFTKIEENIIKINLHRSTKFIQKQIGKKHSIKSIDDKKYNLRKLIK